VKRIARAWERRHPASELKSTPHQWSFGKEPCAEPLFIDITSMTLVTLSPDFPAFAALLGSWEIVLVVAVIIILFAAKKLPDIAHGLGEGLKAARRLPGELDQNAHDAGESLGGIYGKPAFQALTPDNQTAELYDPAVFRNPKRIDRAWQRITIPLLTRLVRLIWRLFSKS